MWNPDINKMVENPHITFPPRSGYSIQISQDKTYVVPTILEQEGLSLGPVEMPDLTEAFEQEGGVSYPKHF